MSILQVSNLHFEGTGNNRIEYSVPDTFVMYAGGNNVFTVNSGGISSVLNIENMTHVSQIAPSDGTIEEDTLVVYVTASGVSPNREIAFKIKTQNNEEIILASTLV